MKISKAIKGSREDLQVNLSFMCATQARRVFSKNRRDSLVFLIIEIKVAFGYRSQGQLILEDWII